MNKNFKKSIIIIIILLVVYNVLMFVIPFPKKNLAVFWVSWFFGLLSIGIQILNFYWLLNKESNYKSKIYGIPVFKVGVLYSIIQLISSIAFIIVNCFLNVPTWIPVIVYVVVISISVIGYISVDSIREEIEKIEEETKSQTSFIKSFRKEINTLFLSIGEDNPIYKSIEKLNEEARLSDPVSNEETSEIEEEMTSKLEILINFINEKKYDEALNAVNDLTRTLIVRNQLCKNNK